MNLLFLFLESLQKIHYIATYIRNVEIFGIVIVSRLSSAYPSITVNWFDISYSPNFHNTKTLKFPRWYYMSISIENGFNV